MDYTEYTYILKIKAMEEPTEEQLFDISDFILDRCDSIKSVSIDKEE